MRVEIEEEYRFGGNLLQRSKESYRGKGRGELLGRL